MSGPVARSLRLPSPQLVGLVLASAVACGSLAARLAFSGRRTFIFLGWNLALAWAPFLFSLAAARLHARAPASRVRLSLLLLAWLAFFPNAPYLVTDLLHLRARPPVPFWYDVAMLASFAVAGCLLMAASLGAVHAVVRARVGRFGGWLFVLGSLWLAALGMYLGRFLRWNSWDLAVHPGAVLRDAAGFLVAPFAHPRTWAFTAIYSLLLLAFYLASPRPTPREGRA